MQSVIKTNKNAAYRLLGIEVAVTAIIVLLLLLFFTNMAALSAFLGGLAYIIPSAWFVRSAYKGNVEPTPQAILSRFYIGEAGKLFLTAVIFAMYFLLVRELNVAALFLTYIIMIVVNLAGLAMIGMKN